MAQKCSPAPGEADAGAPPEEGELLVGEDMELAFEEHAHSFVLRFWLEAGMGQAEWRGWVRHVQTGEKLYFRDLSKILPFLTRFLDAVSDQTEPHPENLRELWRSLSERLNAGRDEGADES